MTKKNELLSVNRELYREMKSIFQSLQSKNELGYYTANANSDILDGKFEYLLGNKQVDFEAAVEKAATPYACSEDHVKSYMEEASSFQSDFINIYRCIGILEAIHNDLIEQMF